MNHSFMAINVMPLDFQDEPTWRQVDANTTNYTVPLSEEEEFDQYLFGVSVEIAAKIEDEENESESNRRVRSVPVTDTVSSGILWSDCTHDKYKGI